MAKHLEIFGGSQSPDGTGGTDLKKWIRNAGLGVVAFTLLLLLWPFNSVPTGYRGVVTQFGAISL